MRHHKRVTFHSIMKDIGKEFKPVATEIRHVDHLALNGVRNIQHMQNKVLDIAGANAHQLGLPLLIIGGVVLLVYVQNRR